MVDSIRTGVLAAEGAAHDITDDLGGDVEVFSIHFLLAFAVLKCIAGNGVGRHGLGACSQN